MHRLQTSVTMTYEFSYNRQLNVNDKIEILLPHWSTSGATVTSSCGNAEFVTEFESNSTYTMTFVASGILTANTFCQIQVHNMTNPHFVMPSNAASIQHRITCSLGGFPWTNIRQVDGITGGITFGDAVSLASSDVGVLTNLNYTFMYSKDIQVGDKIKLKVPGFLVTDHMSKS